MHGMQSPVSALNLEHKMHAGAVQWSPTPTLAELYHRWFEVVSVRTAEQQAEAHRLRYQVYCVENPYEDPAQNPDGLEADEFDDRASHVLLMHRPTGLAAGTVRLILPRPDRLDDSFAMQGVCHDPLLRDRARFPVSRMGEISRFSISKQFRRRLNDGRYPDDGAAEVSIEDERRIIPNMTLGLMQGIFRMSIEHDISHLCAAMEPILLRLLARLGIHFEPIGPIVEYHGRRQPCYTSIVTLLARLRRERPDVWEIVTDGGRLRPAGPRLQEASNVARRRPSLGEIGRGVEEWEHTLSGPMESCGRAPNSTSMAIRTTSSARCYAGAKKRS